MRFATRLMAKVMMAKVFFRNAKNEGELFERFLFFFVSIYMIVTRG